MLTSLGLVSLTKAVQTLKMSVDEENFVGIYNTLLGGTCRMAEDEDNNGQKAKIMV